MSRQREAPSKDNNRLVENVGMGLKDIYLFLTLPSCHWKTELEFVYLTEHCDG